MADQEPGSWFTPTPKPAPSSPEPFQPETPAESAESYNGDPLPRRGSGGRGRDDSQPEAPGYPTPPPWASNPSSTARPGASSRDEEFEAPARAERVRAPWADQSDAPTRAERFEAPSRAERFEAPWADQSDGPSRTERFEEPAQAERIQAPWADQPDTPSWAERFEAPGHAEPPDTARADQTVFRPVPHADQDSSRSANPQSGDYRDQDFDPYENRQRDRYADDDAYPDGGAYAPRRGSRGKEYHEPSPYGRTEPLAYGKGRPGSLRDAGPELSDDDDRLGPPRGGYPDARGMQPGWQPDGGPGKRRRKKAPFIIGGVVAIAVVAAGSAILVPKLTSPTDPGCKAYAGTALTAYNQTISDLNAHASQATLTQDMTTAIADLNSAVGQAQSASTKSALNGLLTELTSVKADVQKGSVPASTVRSLNSAANAADNAC